MDLVVKFVFQMNPISHLSELARMQKHAQLKSNIQAPRSEEGSPCEP